MKNWAIYGNGGAPFKTWLVTDKVLNLGNGSASTFSTRLSNAFTFLGLTQIYTLISVVDHQNKIKICEIWSLIF
jgi:hypothetical protein